MLNVQYSLCPQIESNSIYSLQELAAADDRVVLVKQSGYYWEPYEEIKRNGTLDHIKPVHDGSGEPKSDMFLQQVLIKCLKYILS